MDNNKQLNEILPCTCSSKPQSQATLMTGHNNVMYMLRLLHMETPEIAEITHGIRSTSTSVWDYVCMDACCDDEGSARMANCQAHYGDAEAVRAASVPSDRQRLVS